MSDLYECPADGCSYGPKPKKSVLGHFSGKQDDAHAGGYPEAKRALEGTPEGDPQGDPPESAETDGSGGRTPDVSEPSFPEADGESNRGTVDHSCPSCGSDTDVYTADSVVVMYTKHPGIKLTDAHMKALDDADAACVGCGTAFDVGAGE